jgi:hypothetical protein
VIDPSAAPAPSDAPDAADAVGAPVAPVATGATGDAQDVVTEHRRLLFGGLLPR